MFRKTLFNILFASVIIAFTAVAAKAQDGLGDPVIYRNFGSGTSLYGDAIPGYVGGTAPYLYSSSGVPAEGYYTIINNTNTVSAWWPTLDHTSGDGNDGYMLIVKTRSSGFQVLFEQGVDNLCAGTNYQFAAFIANISRNPGAVTPRIRLRVETNTNPRVQIVPDLSVPIFYSPTGVVWANPIVNFTPPADGSVLVSIISETPGGPSTDDLAIDDVTVNAEGQKIDAQFDAPGSYREVCMDSPTSFSATATAPIPATNVIKWQRKLNDGVWVDIPGETSTTITFTSETVPGIYRYRAASASPDKIAKFSCSVVTNELTVWVKPLVDASAGPPKFYLRGGTPVTLEGSSNSGSIYWTVEPGGADISSLSSTTDLSPLASPNQTTTYVLHATSDNNTCGPEIISRVTVSVADDIKMPNTFTPNGDGINDIWVIGGINSYQNPIVQVYNRNGQLVFRSAGPNASPWDGTYKGEIVPAGSYYYIVDLNINGFKLSGSVTVLR